MTISETDRTAYLAMLVDCLKQWHKNPDEYDLPAMDAALDLDDDLDDVALNKLMRAHHIPTQTNAPCPPFCITGHGHPFDDDPSPTRIHRARLEVGPLSADQDVELGIEQDEFREGSDDSTVRRVVPTLYFCFDGNLTAVDARTLAAALHDAADRLDEVQHS